MGVYIRLIVFMIAAVGLVGCATVPNGAHLVDSRSDLPSVQQEASRVLSQLNIGMPLAEFKRKVPEAYVAGQNESTTAYELAHIQKYVTKSDMDRQKFIWGFGSPNSKTYKQVLWFYFYRNQLVKWGRPQDWPRQPDLIIERRAR